MAHFSYKARDKETHKLINGTIEAVSQSEASKRLRTRGLLVLSVQTDTSVHLSFDFLNRVGARDRILFARELAVMIRAGLPIIQALKSIQGQTTNKTLKKTVATLVSEVEGGTSLSQGFGKYPKIFPSLFVSVAKIGEKSGKLDEVLERLASQLESDDELLSKIRGAMIYPIFVLVALVAVIILILVYIVPQLSTMFEDVGAELPLITKLLLGASATVSKYIVLWIILAIGLVTGFRWWGKNPKVAYVYEQIRFRLPVFGGLARKILMTRFTNTLATLLGAGLPMIEAIKTTADVVNSPTYRRSLNKMAKDIENGQTLSKSLLDDPQFPKMVGHMVAIGETSGNIDTTLTTVGGFFDKDVQNMTRNLSTLIEPLLMAVMGIGVGLVIASVMVPIYNLTNAV